jgi:hypothetical protein
LPLAVGLARTIFFPFKTPAFIASSWGGYRLSYPLFKRTCLRLVGMSSSLTFKTEASSPTTS